MDAKFLEMLCGKNQTTKYLHYIPNILGVCTVKQTLKHIENHVRNFMALDLTDCHASHAPQASVTEYNEVDFQT